MAVFPVMATWGYASEVSFDEIQRVYADLTYRRYLKSTAAHKTRALQLDDISQTEYDTLEAFFIARKQASSPNDQFIIYDPNVVNSIDLTGASSTGRHSAIFLDKGISFTRDGPCSYSGSINVLFLD
jgi:hypothetical protein